MPIFGKRKAPGLVQPELVLPPIPLPGARDPRAYINTLLFEQQKERQEALESVEALRAEAGLLAAEIGALVEEVGAGGRRVQVSMGLTDKFFWFCIYRHMLGKVFFGKN